MANSVNYQHFIARIFNQKGRASKISLRNRGRGYITNVTDRYKGEGRVEFSPKTALRNVWMILRRLKVTLMTIFLTNSRLILCRYVVITMVQWELQSKRSWRTFYWKMSLLPNLCQLLLELFLIDVHFFGAANKKKRSV